MYVVIQPDEHAVTGYARDMVLARLARGFRVLGLPTGSTPLRLYGALIEACRNGQVSFADVVTFNLDEYIGLGPDHPESFRYFMQENFFRHVDIREENIHFLSGLPDDVEAHCEDYEQQIRDAGGIDLQILGIGRDGHIGFNEPASSLRSRTRDKALKRETIEDNRQHFGDDEEVPRWALTMGVGTIMEAREILLLATGRPKASAVRDMVEGPVTAMCTASALQAHPRMTVVCDEAAAAKLDQDEYYRWMVENDYKMQAFLSERRKEHGE